jgi:ABC-type uncharacterized transport system permease subunit
MPLASTIPPLVYLFVWSTAAGEQTLGGMSRGEFVAYYLILMLVNQLTYSQANWTVGDVIRDGSFNSWLLRPLSPLYHPLASDIADMTEELSKPPQTRRAKQSLVVALPDDWRTQGDWLGRYGRYWACW